MALGSSMRMRWVIISKALLQVFCTFHSFNRQTASIFGEKEERKCSKFGQTGIHEPSCKEWTHDCRSDESSRHNRRNYDPRTGKALLHVFHYFGNFLHFLVQSLNPHMPIDSNSIHYLAEKVETLQGDKQDMSCIYVGFPHCVVERRPFF